jgi:hypothetical protein
VPPDTGAPEVFVELLLLLLLLLLELQAAAVIATAASTAAAARRSLRLPRCMCAPSSWRAGARVCHTGSC